MKVEKHTAWTVTIDLPLSFTPRGGQGFISELVLSGDNPKVLLENFSKLHHEVWTAWKELDRQVCEKNNTWGDAA